MHTGNLKTKSADPFVLSSGIFTPGKADDFCRSITDTGSRAICESELLFYRGHFDLSAESIQPLAKSNSVKAKLAYYLISAMNAMAAGDTDNVKEYISLISDFGERSDDPSAVMTAGFLLIYFKILIHDPDSITFPPVGIDAFSVEDSLKPLAVYAYAHYLEMTDNIGRAIGLAECALIFMDKPRPVTEIYLALIISAGYTRLTCWDKAEYYFRLAWSRAQPDSLIMPFAQMRGLLGGMLEKCLRCSYPAEYRRINELSQRYHKNWVHVHNEFTGATVSDKLTAIEFNIATLASRSMTNTEIADFLGISVNSVRAHLRNIFNKLSVDSRKQLAGYVIQ